MGKRMRNDGLAGIMASDQNTTSMAACVPFHAAYLVLKPNFQSRGTEKTSQFHDRGEFSVFLLLDARGEIEFDEPLELIQTI